jgi:hypothetical protein
MAGGFSKVIKVWNTKLHIYTGLFLFISLWLFSFTGFLMNHPQWFGGMPDRSKQERPVQIPAGLDDSAKARAVMNQLGLEGEYLQSPSQKGHFFFRVIRPSRRYFVDVDLETQQAVVTTATPTFWGQLADLHTTNGVRAIWREPEPETDWVMTRLWVFAMDATCVGVIFLVISSMYMWLQLKKKRAPGLLAFALGCLACAFFIWGLSY